MDVGGISRRIVDFAMALVGWITGSLLLVAAVTPTEAAALAVGYVT
jgi:C4-dicarboxylate transporter DctM subunit